MIGKLKDLLKATVVAFVIVLAAIAIMVIVWAWGLEGRRWPAVADSATLLADCATLLAQLGPDQEGNWSPPVVVEEEDWPPSVKSLRPVHVRVRDDYVVIMTSKGGIGGPYGYLVYPDGRRTGAAASGRTVTHRVSPGLFKYAVR